MNIPPGPFGFIHCDPAWQWLTYAKKPRVPTLGEQPYDTISFDDLKALPVAASAAKNCVLLMWVISSHVDQAIALGSAWGFKYKSLGPIWCKTQKHAPTKPKMGMGKWVRQEAEITLLFTRGKPKRIDAGVRQMIFEPAREHSRKPDEIYPICERLAAGPYLDMFGRCSREHWSVWGNEATKFDTPQPVAKAISRHSRPAPSDPHGPVILDLEDAIAERRERPTPTELVKKQRSRHAPPER